MWVKKFWFFNSNVSLAMTKAGLATVYDRTGAVFGGIKDQLVKAEQVAKGKRIGMWSQDPDKYESPMDFKSKQKAEGALKLEKAE